MHKEGMLWNGQHFGTSTLADDADLMWNWIWRRTYQALTVVLFTRMYVCVLPRLMSPVSIMELKPKPDSKAKLATAWQPHHPVPTCIVLPRPVSPAAVMAKPEPKPNNNTQA
jgi:hypothetical protein